MQSRRNDTETDTFYCDIIFDLDNIFVYVTQCIVCVCVCVKELFTFK